MLIDFTCQTVNTDSDKKSDKENNTNIIFRCTNVISTDDVK